MENQIILIILATSLVIIIVIILIIKIIHCFKNQSIPAELYEELTNDDYSNVWEQIETKQNQK